jgi:hypothetical protein
VLDAAGHDDQLARADLPVAVSELHEQTAADDEEQLVLRVVVVPDELAGELHDLHVHVVHFTDDLRRPAIRESRELVREIDHVDHASSAHASLSRRASARWRRKK